MRRTIERGDRVFFRRDHGCTRQGEKAVVEDMRPGLIFGAYFDLTTAKGRRYRSVPIERLGKR